MDPIDPPTSSSSGTSASTKGSQIDSGMQRRPRRWFREVIDVTSVTSYVLEQKIELDMAELKATFLPGHHLMCGPYQDAIVDPEAYFGLAVFPNGSSELAVGGLNFHVLCNLTPGFLPRKRQLQIDASIVVPRQNESGGERSFVEVGEHPKVNFEYGTLRTSPLAILRPSTSTEIPSASTVTSSASGEVHKHRRRLRGVNVRDKDSVKFLSTFISHQDLEPYLYGPNRNLAKMCVKLTITVPLNASSVKKSAVGMKPGGQRSKFPSNGVLVSGVEAAQVISFDRTASVIGAWKRSLLPENDKKTGRKRVREMTTNDGLLEKVWKFGHMFRGFPFMLDGSTDCCVTLKIGCQPPTEVGEVNNLEVDDFEKGQTGLELRQDGSTGYKFCQANRKRCWKDEGSVDVDYGDWSNNPGPSRLRENSANLSDVVKKAGILQKPTTSGSPACIKTARYFAHRAVLSSHSPVFANMLSWPVPASKIITSPNADHNISDLDFCEKGISAGHRNLELKKFANQVDFVEERSFSDRSDVEEESGVWVNRDGGEIRSFSNPGEIPVPAELVSSEVVYGFMHVLYDSEFLATYACSPSLMMGIYKLADYFQISGITVFCSRALCTLVSPLNLPEVMVFAKTYCQTDLLAACCRVMVSKMEQMDFGTPTINKIGVIGGNSKVSSHLDSGTSKMDESNVGISFGGASMPGFGGQDARDGIGGVYEIGMKSDEKSIDDKELSKALQMWEKVARICPDELVKVLSEYCEISSFFDEIVNNKLC